MTEPIPVRRVTFRTADAVRLFAVAFLFLLVWRVLWMAIQALFLGLIAVLLAVVLHSGARWLTRWLPYRLAFGVVVLLFLGGLVGLLVLLIPQLFAQVGQLAQQLPPATRSALRWVETRLGVRAGPEIVTRLGQQLDALIERFVPLAVNVIGVLVGALAVIVLAIFLAYRPDVYRRLLLCLVPPSHRPRWDALYAQIGKSLRAWVLGKALTMLLVGVATWIGLTLFGLPGALALAALAALLEFVPNLGPTLAAVPAVIAGFLESPSTALYVALFYFGLQQVQNAVTVPLVEQRAVNIPPAILLIWQLMLAVSFGILGLFVATPLLSILTVAVRVLYVEPTEARARAERRRRGVAPEEPEEAASDAP